MKLQDVIARALTDVDFAQELKDKAMVAHQAGTDTDEWEDFMSYFAADAQELAIFRTLTVPGVDCTTPLATTMTVTSTVACTFTTTTTTQSKFCG